MGLYFTVVKAFIHFPSGSGSDSGKHRKNKGTKSSQFSDGNCWNGLCKSCSKHLLSTFIVLSPVLIISRREMMKITSVSITAPSEVSADAFPKYRTRDKHCSRSQTDVKELSGRVLFFSVQ